MDKKELKRPDAFQAELQKGFQWTTQHSKLVMLVIGAFLLVGGGFAAKNYVNEKNEEKIQSKYFVAERAFLEKRAGYQSAIDALNTKPATPNPVAPVKASGDYEKDYAAVAGPLEQIITEAPHSKAAKMAALNLAQVQTEYKKFDAAKKALTTVNDNSKDLLGAMVQMEMGTLLANENDCAGALSQWEKVISNKRADYLHASVQLKMGLCYESMNEVAKAEEFYAKAASAKDSSVGKSADKYLRLLMAKKI